VNPKTIIITALFVFASLYGIASLVTVFGSFGAGERLPLIYFLIAFPVLSLGFVVGTAKHLFKDES
jgi:hypothetical protein